jgi:N-methylhydantoinase B/oxoprolinase/acetone carboxylase alpha subunit
VQELPGKFNVRLQAGERIRVESPGAGGWGEVGEGSVEDETLGKK